MQTLGLLGLPFVGEPQSHTTHCLWEGYNKQMGTNLDDLPIDLKDEAIACNPKGYYELDLLTLIMIARGLYKEDTSGKVVKLMGELMINCPNDQTEKIIFCKRRDLDAQVKSNIKLAEIDMEINEVLELDNPYAEMYETMEYKDWEKQILFQTFLLDKKIVRGTIPYIDLYFEDMLEEPKKHIERLVSFLELKEVDINKAINNVDKRK